MAATAAAAAAGSRCLFAPLARGEVVAAISAKYGDVVKEWPSTSGRLPVVYHSKYNIGFFGIEKLHPFDSHKFGKVVQSLVRAQLVTWDQLVTPLEATREALLDVHTPEYIHQIHAHNLKIVQVTELPPLTMLPNFLLQWRVISPMKYHVAGTMLAAALAMQYGWAINIGGGMHHAYSSDGMGWCPFADIMLAVRRLRVASGGFVRKVLLIDLDAHQGNGVERDKLKFNDVDLFIVDIYNGGIFPGDDVAKPAIDVDVPLFSGTLDAEYLAAVTRALQQAQAAFKPDLIIYNAGTDILQGDPLGRFAVSAEAVRERDEMVWRFALEEKVPICMLLSGGYARDSATVISSSLMNLWMKFNLGNV